MADDGDSIKDKTIGRVKKAAGDLAGDSGLRREGAKDEKKGEAKDQLDDAKEKVQEKADEIGELEKKD
jgi:uncharacterized protein YjbJ (UPF0337 family)